MSKHRILVVDDDAWILRMVTTVLEKRGYLVDTASDGVEAFEKAQQNPPSLLITDVMMPNMDGWTLVKAMRGRPEFAFVPVIFLTALGSDDDRIRGFQLGADDYLPKPFRFEELDLRVGKTMERVQQLKEATQDKMDTSENSQPDGSKNLQGSLSELGLSSLLVLLEMERKSGILTASSHEGRIIEGTIHFRNGRVLKAGIDCTPPLQNEEAIYYMLRWTEGHFSFSKCEISEEEEGIDASTTAILMEGARRIDEQGM